MKKKLPITIITVILIIIICSFFIKPSRSIAPTIDAITPAPTGISITPSVTPDGETSSKSGLTLLEDYLLEVETESGKISIPLKDIPILYDAMTSGYDLADPIDMDLVNFQLSRISPQVIFAEDDTSYILINYDCGAKLCDYVLVKYKNDNLQSLYINDGAFCESKISVDKRFIAFQFAWPEGNQAVYHTINLVDIETMELVTLQLPKEYDYTVISWEWQASNQKGAPYQSYHGLSIEYQKRGKDEIRTFVS